jgi:hypothetical protein
MKNLVHPIITVVCLLAGVSQSCQTPASFSNQFISSEKYKIEVSVTDGSIQLNSPDLGGFSQCKPYLAWRDEGADQWTEDFSTNIRKEKISDKETKLSCKLGPVDATILIKELDDHILEFSGAIKNISFKTIELARFHYLHGSVNDPKANFAGNIPWSFKVVKKTDTLSAPRADFQKSWKSMGVDWLQLSTPIHDEANWATSLDFGVFGESLSTPDWFFGFTGPGTAFGEIGFKTQVEPSPFFAGVLLDNIILEPDSVRILEKFIIHAGDWQEGMAYWVKRTAGELNARSQTNLLTGYCSWYQRGWDVNMAVILKANYEFADLPLPPGGRTIQTDAGWQQSAGDWKPNSKFQKGWKELPQLISGKGSIPGLWISPTAIDPDHPIHKSHPEMLQRLSNGDIPIYFPDWGHFLEIDRPDCREFINKFMKEKVDEGWRYFKVDFMYPLSTARVAYDRKKTSFQSYRDFCKLLRESCGPDILINTCIGSIDRYPIGYVNIDRIGGDIGSDWKTVQSNLRDLLSRACTNGNWWQADPDVFYMRKENSSLNDEENFLLTGSVYLIGGTFLSSDFPSQWSPESRKIVDSLWTSSGLRIPERHFVDYGDNNSIKAYMVSFNDSKAPGHKLGIYNWSDKAETVSVSLEELRLKPDLNWNATLFIHTNKVSLLRNSITIENMPPHSLRIVELSLE